MLGVVQFIRSLIFVAIALGAAAAAVLNIKNVVGKWIKLIHAIT